MMENSGPLVLKIEGLSGDAILIQRARDYAQEGNHEEAAPLYEKAKRPSQAATQYKAANDLPNAVRCYKEHFQGRVDRVEELLENEEIEKAVTAWKQARESYVTMRGLEPEIDPKPADFDTLADTYTKIAEQMKPYMEQYDAL